MTATLVHLALVLAVIAAVGGSRGPSGCLRAELRQGWRVLCRIGETQQYLWRRHIDGPHREPTELDRRW
ncbi:hypothetical protein [Pseudonocardia nigra]|uniref:hypothetical protein n=1 Tax=Pseudonocardia nigra TaxID=1921578 RepID=UPI001C5F6A3D|nr:hypothetical protein [Pseudonocardia nigra]